jgi:hypothetical protein
MDLTQTNHLKAYGLTFWVIKNQGTADWLLNYKNGSFGIDYSDKVANECRIRGVYFEQLSDAEYNSIVEQVKSEKTNMDVVKLEKAPKIAVYAPPGALPWDDAVRLALEYAEVEHTIIWDEEVIQGKLKEYDWLHLHHEDFTGQYSKFGASFANAPWYIQQVTLNESTAKKLGYSKVSELKRATCFKIREFVANGGYLFTMCNATESIEIALASYKTDIVDAMYDGDAQDFNANSKLDFTQTFATENFQINLDPYDRGLSNIDTGPTSIQNPDADNFTLFEFSAKYDPVPTMLTQNHEGLVKGFVGVTTAMRKEVIKKAVTILGEREKTNEVKYIHGMFGRGTFTFYSGHDPEDYTHHIGDPPTDLNLHKNSPGYRLILNNILFPAAKKKKQKT